MLFLHFCARVFCLLHHQCWMDPIDPVSDHLPLSTTTRRSLCHIMSSRKRSTTLSILFVTVYFRHKQPTSDDNDSQKERKKKKPSKTDTWIRDSRPGNGALVVVIVDVSNVIMAWAFIHTTPSRHELCCVDLWRRHRLPVHGVDSDVWEWEKSPRACLFVQSTVVVEEYPLSAGGYSV